MCCTIEVMFLCCCPCKTAAETTVLVLEVARSVVTRQTRWWYWGYRRYINSFYKMSTPRPWRDAASLILLARNAAAAATTTSSPASSAFDYQILMLRRSSRSQFMPNAYVFPGGVSSPSDLDKGWLELFKKYGKRDYQEVVARGGATQKRPFLMTPQPGEEVPRDLAFRICAIRETFEESGIFLGDDNKRVPVTSTDLLPYRSQIHKDASKFLQMCRDMEVCPDIWGLTEWRCWLTPLGKELHPGNRRFDTIFYTAFLDSVDEFASLDEVEITDLCWADPEFMLTENKLERLWLAPPQVYELTQLGNSKRLEELEEICKGPQKKDAGISSWMPVFRRCKDATLSILPGDELYPEVPDYLGKEGGGEEVAKMDATVEEINERYPRCNRLAIFSMNNNGVFVRGSC